MSVSSVSSPTAGPGVSDLGSLAGRLKARDPRAVDQAAQEMEALFLSMLLKEMRQTLEPGELFGKDGGDNYGGLFDFFLGQQLAQNGGMGLADVLKAQMLKSAPHHEPAQRESASLL